MFRLLQGDVGSGKTIVAIAVMLNAVEAGSQAAIMVPTEVLAMQHFEKISKLLIDLEVRVELLIGSMTQAIKNKIQHKLITGEVDIVVGTHALFQEKVAFKDLKLVVIDEQHRFGVNQRVALVQKGEMADLLMMTATPIPRTLSIVNYGDMDVSIMNEKPAFRQDIKTTIIKFSQLDMLAQRVEAVIAKGDKVYWVCPLIDESEKVNLSNIMKRYEYLQAQFGEEVTIMHGKMSTAEREQNMKLFQSGKTKILLATTVIEVGVDDPDATIMIIENAERFGLSQLHQLRGRVGRGSKPSYCVLVSNFAKNSAPVARLNVLTESNDGFYISEKDLEIRGSGDMLGTRQSGMLEFRMFNPIANQRIAMLAAETATNITNNITSFEELSQELKILLSLFSLEQFTIKKDKLS
jgi:ATP-dependent DNA helicase RecG